MSTRIEHDLIGDKEISNEYYYGVQTARAVENFHITGVTLGSFPTFLESIAKVKKAAALANYELQLLAESKKNAITATSPKLKKNPNKDFFSIILK